MVGPLLETKLHVPRWRRSLVARPRLSERLSRGAESALTLVSAPAGFGKTTLLAEWLAVAAAGERSVAWLSLDQRDNDPALFWTYVVAALNTGTPGGGAGAPPVVQDHDRLPPHSSFDVFGRAARRDRPPRMSGAASLHLNAAPDPPIPGRPPRRGDRRDHPLDTAIHRC